MRTPHEEQATSVLYRQRKKATIHWLLYRSIDGEKPELCRYKCMFLGLGILFMLFSGVLFAQVAVPAMQKRNQAVEIEVPKEELAEMPQTEVPVVEAQVEVVESDAQFGVISTHFVDPIGNAISAIDMPKIPEVVGSGIVAVNTGDTVPEESIEGENIEGGNVEEEVPVEAVPTPRIPAPVSVPEQVSETPKVPFPNIPPPSIEKTPPVPSTVPANLPSSITIPLEELKEEPKEDIYTGGMFVYQANQKTEGSLVYSSTGVSDAPATVYQSASPNNSSMVFSGNTSQNTASTVYSDKPNQAPITVYSDQSNQQPSTIYNQDTVTSSQATVYDRTQETNQVANQVVGETNPTALTNIASFANGEITELLPPSASLKAGDIIPAKLVTGISISKGNESPLVAISEGDWCNQSECETIRWLGTASYSSGNRVEVTFERFMVAGILEEVDAVGLSTDNTPGILAMIQDTTPTAAQDVLRNSIGGLSDYAEALANETTSIVSEGIVTQTKKTPSLSSFILGGAASTFKPPEGSTAFVRLANIRPDSSILVLYGVEQP